MTEDQAKKIATHREYKGGLCRLLHDKVLRTEVNEVLVIYQYVWPYDPQFYACPASMFYGTVEFGKERFTKLEVG